MVKIGNTTGAKRSNKFITGDKLEVKDVGVTGQYILKPRVNFTDSPTTVKMTIADAGAGYSGRTGIAWKLTFSDGTIDLSSVRVGDIVTIDISMQSSIGYVNTTIPSSRGIDGFPIVEVHSGTPNYIVIINPIGQLAAIQPIGSYVKIYPGIGINWKNQSNAYNFINYINF